MGCAYYDTSHSFCGYYNRTELTNTDSVGLIVCNM